MLGVKSHLTFEERFDHDKRVHSTLVLLYIVNVFTYSLAIILLSYQQYIAYKTTLPTNFTQLILNWQQTPINNIYFDNTGTIVQLTLENKIANKLPILNNNGFVQISYSKVETFTFMNNYTAVPYCQNKQLCGGWEESTKICSDINTLCPLTEFKLKPQSEIFYNAFDDYIIDSSVYSIGLQGSTYSPHAAIIDIRYGFNDQVCIDPAEFYICTKIALNYIKIYTVNATTFLQANNIPIDTVSVNDTVSLFAQRYIPFNMQCRLTLMERVTDSTNYYDDIGTTLYIQTIICLVYCAFVGLFLNIIHFLLLSDLQFITVLPTTSQTSLQMTRRVVVTFRILSFLPYGTIICLLYFYESQMYDTINRVLGDQCLSDNFIFIFDELIDQIDDIRKYQVSIFSIFIYGLALEIFSILLYMYRGASNKKENLIQKQYEQELELNHDANYKQNVANRISAKPYMRPSFTVNDQRAFRQSILNSDPDQQLEYRKSQMNILSAIADDEDEYDKPDQQKKDSARPVWNEPDQQLYGAHQTPTNQNQHNNNMFTKNKQK